MAIAPHLLTDPTRWKDLTIAEMDRQRQLREQNYADIQREEAEKAPRLAAAEQQAHADFEAARQAYQATQTPTEAAKRDRLLAERAHAIDAFDKKEPDFIDAKNQLQHCYDEMVRLLTAEGVTFNAAGAPITPAGFTPSPAAKDASDNYDAALAQYKTAESDINQLDTEAAHADAAYQAAIDLVHQAEQEALQRQRIWANTAQIQAESENKVLDAQKLVEKAQHQVQIKDRIETHVQNKGVALEQSIEAYKNRPNAYQAVKDAIDGNGHTSLAGADPRTAATQISEKQQAEDLIEQIRVFEYGKRDATGKIIDPGYKDLPVNARASWTRRLERRNHYAKLAKDVRDHHKQVAESYAGLTRELKERAGWISARNEVLTALKEERQIARLELDGELNTRGLLRRIGSRLVMERTVKNSLKWAGDWLKSWGKTADVRGHYKEQIKLVKDQEKDAADARKRLRKTLENVSRNALRK